MSNIQYSVIDLFAGCGGLSLGLYQAGWNGIFAIEKNPNAFETLNFNLIERKRHFDWPKWLPITPLDILDVNQKYKGQLKKCVERLTSLLVVHLVKAFQWQENE